MKMPGSTDSMGTGIDGSSIKACDTKNYLDTQSGQ